MTTTTDPTTTDVPDVTELVEQLTLEEKAALLGGSDVWRTTPVERLGIGKIWLSDGPHGLRAQAEDGDHLGLLAADPAVAFPPAAALASTWDVDLLARVGAAIGEEARAKGVSVVLGPGVNMKRSPLCGRNFEYFSEDPRLAGTVGAAFVKGVQSQGVGTSLKHFAANNQETDRMSVSADVDERTLREIYLPAFERVVAEAQPWTVMCSYNRINGVFASQDRWLLTDVLRDEWGFEGVVVSDWGAVLDREKAVHAGLDLEMPSSGGLGTQRVLDAVAAGELSLEDVDVAVTRVLELVAKSQPALADRGTADLDAHHALAREAATRSAVLLQNDGVLPLDPASSGTVAVVGELARTPRFQGGGSSQVTPTRVDAALPALQDALGERLVFAAGYPLDDDAPAAETAALRDEALAAARDADVVLLFLGLPDAYESEGFDRTHLHLPAQQLALLEVLAEECARVVVVLSNGSVVEVAPWRDRAAAILETWLLGQAGGDAVADLLLGRANPSGRLAETFPLRYEDNPALGNFPGEAGHVRYGEGLLIGYRWYDARDLEVAFPFGHGLSYTTFAYSDLAVDVLDDGPTPRVRVALTVKNTGERAGNEVVQVYVTDPESSVFRPVQELGGFGVVELAAGATERVQVELDARAFQFWHPEVARWVVEPGRFGIRVGASSRDVRLVAEIELAGEVVVPELTVDSTVEAWLAHPVAGPGLRAQLEAEPRAAAMFFAPGVGEMMRAIPLRRIARFPGFPVPEAELETLAAQADAAYRAGAR
ncbi:glycoside hydrolase family 3 C-terminal domain-containing protein [Luteimicrobium xylanilyticum]|uniref:Exo-alpha-(1->6)-L-arabinopyranosidase n=1 Tax=Luteimicrobium xylanilyticum TaxID=1133546 RepID=A0A5P9QD16_9MICO|nr:glycoside hydrolase family 3 C-terminal domain-containing protein [Luteimicrobium xylanilyticum]QFU99344.1 Beta-glucosidase [Luteimicrobium xylanilyticum]